MIEWYAQTRADSTLLFITHPLLSIFICVLVTLMIAGTLVGNVLVCMAVALVRRLKQQPANLLLVSLAVSDFFVGLFVMPLALVELLDTRWLLGDTLCTFWTTSDLMLCTLNLCLISVDRYLAVTQPLTYCARRTRRRVLFYVAVVWLGALLVACAPLAFLGPSRGRGTCQIYATVLSFYAPGCIMVFLYIRMWKAAKRLQLRDRHDAVRGWSRRRHHTSDDTEGSGGQSSGGGGSEDAMRRRSEGVLSSSTMMSPRATRASHEGAATTIDVSSPRRAPHRPSSSFFHAVRVPLLSTSSRQDDKATKTLGIIMSVFIGCWMPFFLLAVVKSQSMLTVPRWLDALALWLGYVNSALNPLIYSITNRDWRVPFVEMLCCRFSTLRTVMRNESFKSRYGEPRLHELRNSTMTATAALAAGSTPMTNGKSGESTKWPTSPSSRATGTSRLLHADVEPPDSESPDANDGL